MADTAFTVQLDATLSKQAFARLQSQAPTVIARALNRAADSGKTIMVREISRDLGLKSSDVRDTVRVEGAQPHRLMAQVIATGKRIPLSRFNATGPVAIAGGSSTPRKGGVRYRIGSQRRTIPSGFIVQLSSGHRGVFVREGQKRLPIVERFGPSIPHVFRKFLPVGIARAQEQLLKNLQSGFRFATRQAAGG